MAMTPSGTHSNSTAEYDEAIAHERRAFENCRNVHELPPIFYYWSNRYLRPKLIPFGFDRPDAMFGKFLKEECAKEPGVPKRFVSLGSGNCDLEIEVALHLRACGHESFVVDCVDLNPVMLERGRAAAESAGLADCFEFVSADFNNWTPVHRYDAVIANQSLHHVLNLEGLFEQVKQSLKPGAPFIMSDMIGRNGHQRWPEALEGVHEFWRRLPPSYRFNLRFNRYEEMYRDWDCSVAGFEGIRSEDILPLLLRNFNFRFFLPFANIVDPFTDRAFGYHFDATAPWDLALIDEIHRRDEEWIASGRIKPTHMLAVVTNEPCAAPVYPENLSPEFCVRPPDENAQRSVAPSNPDSPYLWNSWPHDPARQLESVCERFAQSEIVQLQTQAELDKRTLWALRLDKELEERTAWALCLRDESESYKAAALRLASDLEERTAWALRLRAEVESARGPNNELEIKTREIRPLHDEMHNYFRYPLRYLRRLADLLLSRVRARTLRRNTK